MLPRPFCFGSARPVAGLGNAPNTSGMRALYKRHGSHNDSRTKCGMGVENRIAYLFELEGAENVGSELQDVVKEMQASLHIYELDSGSNLCRYNTGSRSQLELFRCIAMLPSYSGHFGLGSDFAFNLLWRKTIFDSLPVSQRFSNRVNIGSPLSLGRSAEENKASLSCVDRGLLVAWFAWVSCTRLCLASCGSNFGG